MNSIKKGKYRTIIAYLFFIFFTAPILSPALNNFTIYLYWFIPFLDIYFAKEVIYKIRNKKLFISFYAIILLLLILNKIVLMLKIITTATTVMYLFYAKRNGYFNIFYKFMVINVLIAITQFILIYIDPNLAFLIGPTNISKSIWGRFATETFTNFYAVYSLPRVCGLSREAGFFASLLCTTIIIYILDKDIKKNKLIVLLYSIGFVISFSKVSIIYLPIIIVLLMRKIINTIPIPIGITIFIVLVVFISNNLLIDKYYNSQNESIIHRISGYTVMSKMDFNYLITGVDTIDKIEGLEKYSFVGTLGKKFDQYAGIPNTIIHEGMIIFVIFIFVLMFMGVKFSGFLILTLISFTTSYFTSTSHIVLGYFIIFYFKSLHKRCKVLYK